MWQWIEEMCQKVCDLERRVRLSKANVEQIVTLMAGWSQTPLYQRKEDKKDCLLGLEVNYNIYMLDNDQRVDRLFMSDMPISPDGNGSKLLNMLQF